MEQLNHAENYFIHPKNIKAHLIIDEVNLSEGAHFTFVTNKNGIWNKKVVTAIKGTKSQDIIDVMNKISLDKRNIVKEITP